MIPYDELCSALARWRERQGLVNGPSAIPPQGAILIPPPAAPALAPAETSGELLFAASVSSGFGDTVPTEEHVADPPTQITRSPYEPEIISQLDDDDPDAPTGLHLTPEAIPPGRDITNELEIDDLDDPDEPQH